MPSTYTNLGLEQVADDEKYELWGFIENDNKAYLDEAIAGVVSIPLTTTPVTLVTVIGESGETIDKAGRHKIIRFTGTPSGTVTVNIAPNYMQKDYIIDNQTTQTVSITQGSGDSVDILSNHISHIYCDGAGVDASVFLISTSVESLTIAASDETTSLTTGLAKTTFRADHRFILTDVRASVSVAPTGLNIIVDINVNGVSIFTVPLNIDVGTLTSVGSASPYIMIPTDIPDNAEIKIDIDQVGSINAGAGLKVSLIGRKR